MKYDHAIVKFNGGLGALLCNSCNVIIAEGTEHEDKIHRCDDCLVAPKFFSTKRFGPISTGHRQWRHDGHCSYAHGYGRIVKIIFGASSLDERGWAVDFGDLNVVRDWLDAEWDHRILLANDDPLLDQFRTLHELGGVNINVMPEGYGPGIEMSCMYVYDYVSKLIEERTQGRCWVQMVEIWEHENNSAIYGQFPV